MTVSDKLSRICADCSLGGSCCREARPPLTPYRMDLMVSRGMDPKAIEKVGYHRLKIREDGFCILFTGGVCTMHQVKPETCVAGPFTFDIQDGRLNIYLKEEAICPLAGMLLRDAKAYEAQYHQAVESFRRLVKDLPPQELAEILKIEEPETFKVGEEALDV